MADLGFIPTLTITDTHTAELIWYGMMDAKYKTWESAERARREGNDKAADYYFTRGMEFGMVGDVAYRQLQLLRDAEASERTAQDAETLARMNAED